MFRLDNISHRIGKKAILAGCSLEIEPGKLTALVGPNGAGKSTLLKIAAQEIVGYTGSVQMQNKDVGSFTHRELSRLRAVLPQHTNVSFPFTAEQVIEIGRYPHLTTESENQRILNAVLAITHLTSFRRRVYQTLSGGEQQRVQLARVLAQTWDETLFPKYILLDEPTSSLDLAQQHNIMKLVRQALTRNIGVLAIIHDLNLAIQYADRLAFLKSGKIMAHGETEKVSKKEIIEETYDHPIELIVNSTGRPVICALSESIQPLENYPHATFNHRQ